MINYIFGFIGALIVSVILTLLVKKIAIRFDITDKPNSERKIQTRPIPLLGGVAIFLSFNLILFYFAFFSREILTGQILFKHLIGLFIAGLIIIIGGVLDDKYNLKAKYQIIFPLLAVLIVIISGIGITYIRNPLGGVFQLDQFKFTLLWYQGLPYRLTLLSDIFTIIWLMGMMYTTKFLDGLDGLVSGVSVIAGLVIAGISLANEVSQPQTALIAFIFAGACAGFLIFNFNPAKIFLGESGSLFCGFILGVLAIIAGSKVATALLIMGIPILDAMWVVIRRLKQKKSPFWGDKKHLHFRLLELGLSQRQAVLLLYILTATFGAVALLLPTQGKAIVFIILVISMILIGLIWYNFYRKKNAPTDGGE